MMRFIRWYQVAAPVMHLEAFTFNGTPIWTERFSGIADYDEDCKAGQALAACKAFHGREEDIVIVTLKRVRKVPEWKARVGQRVVTTDEVLVEYRGCSGLIVAVDGNEVCVRLDQHDHKRVWWHPRFLRKALPSAPTHPIGVDQDKSR